MKNLKTIILAVIAMLVLSGAIPAQSGRVIVYNDVDFTGANTALTANWAGGGAFDRNIRSIRVPPGARVTIYDRRDYAGTQAVLTEDWNPGSSAWWIGRIRSIRVDYAQIQPPVGPRPPTPPVTGNFPVIYAQANYQGPAQAVERDWAGSRDWNGFPHRIRSIRVPAGWRLTLYERANFGGTETVITSNISWKAGDYWNGRVLSIRVSRDGGGPQPPTPPTGEYPAIYAQSNYKGMSLSIERDWAGSVAWSGFPYRVNSIRVPRGWYLVLYSQRNFGGESYNLDSSWSPQAGDQWLGRTRSIKIYRGTPPRQPR